MTDDNDDKCTTVRTTDGRRTTDNDDDDGRMNSFFTHVSLHASSYIYIYIYIWMIDRRSEVVYDLGLLIITDVPIPFAKLATFVCFPLLMRFGNLLNIVQSFPQHKYVCRRKCNQCVDLHTLEA